VRFENIELRAINCTIINISLVLIFFVVEFRDFQGICEVLDYRGRFLRNGLQLEGKRPVLRLVIGAADQKISIGMRVHAVSTVNHLRQKHTHFVWRISARVTYFLVLVLFRYLIQVNADRKLFSGKQMHSQLRLLVKLNQEIRILQETRMILHLLLKFFLDIFL
jgi:hypothetical protein